MNDGLIKRFSLVSRKSVNYFEGWYLRLLDKAQDINLALIFAYTKNKTDPHAFIQVYEGHHKKNTYYRFPLNDFSFKNNEVKIAENTLSLKGVTLNLKEIHLEATLDDIIPIKQHSAMGYLKRLPLQCYQEVVFIGATFKGTFNNKAFNGDAYMEKTYGTKFPKKWFWLQALEPKEDVRFTLAGGHVPTLFLKPFGFFAIFQYQDLEVVFATYNGAKCKVHSTEDHHYFTLIKGAYKLTVKAKKRFPVKLVGPNQHGLMNLDVYEDLYTDITLTMYQNKEILVEVNHPYAGFEWMLDQRYKN